MTAYIAKVNEVFEFSPGGWRGLKVGVFRVDGDSEEQIGEYKRDYGSLFRTFYHFMRDHKDYALYSPNYDVTRVMELPSCKDIGGEEPHSLGFCPVDFYVPSYIERESMNTLDKKIWRYRVNEPEPKDLVARTERHEYTNIENVPQISETYSYPTIPRTFYSFGFIAGCIWGDDSTYKIQYLDLSDADKGVIKRDDRFGYIELPEGITLKQAIDMCDYGYDPTDEDSYFIRVAVMKRFDLRIGKNDF